jgi:Family of unknown function (DUF6932)
VERFGSTPRRRELLAACRRTLDLLRSYGCRWFYLDGSFVTAKDEPGDYDGCWEVDGVDLFRLLREAPLLWDDSRGRPNQKAAFGGDLFPMRLDGDLGDRVVFDDFQHDPQTDAPKGIIALDLEQLP